jgi:GT2 family glycosyltransferase
VSVSPSRRITAVVATHNRVATTIRCLESLVAASGSVQLTVVHVDDASSDGTAGAVADLLPDAIQLRGDGGLYWAGGMRLGLARAEEDDPDYLLWLNDDVVLDPGAIDALLDLAPSPEEATIAVGALRDPDNGSLTYAAVRHVHTWRGRGFDPIPPGSDEQPVAMNGNLVLVPRRVRRVVGTMGPRYSHAMADYDYGLRATRMGVRIRSTPTTVGTCARNDDSGTWRDLTLSRRQRLRLLNAPTGRPLREWAHFQRRNGGNWPAATLSPYVRTLIAPPRPSARTRPEVAIVYKSLPHYRVPLYQTLRDRLDDEGVDLRLLIGDPPVGEPSRHDTTTLDWAERVPQRELPLGSTRLVWQQLPGRVRHSDLVVVEQASKLLVNNVLALWRHVGGPALGLWGHGVNRDQRHRSPIGEWWKRRVLTDCDWWFAYTAGTAAYVTASGFPADRTTDLRNATDTTALQAAADRLRADRDERGTEPVGPPTVAFVGSLYTGKGLDDLVVAADRVREQVGDVEFVVVGDGEDRAILDAAASTRPWFRLLGPRTGDALAEALANADCVVCPAAVGLVVLDAFALGLPVVTAQADNHGPEIDYVRDDENGIVVRAAASDPAFAEAVVRVLEDAHLRERLVDGARATAREFTIDAMAERFADGILRCLGRR